MRSPLETRIAALRGRVRRLLALHGMAWVVAALAVAVILAGLADWLVHLVPEVRLALLIGAVALAGWLGWRRVVTPLVVRFRDLDIALRIERRWPGLNDRLSSTIEFLRARDQAGDASAGSEGLRAATVARTLAEVDSIDFRAVVDPRPARRAALAALGVLAVGLAILGAAPAAGRLALTRLFAPYGGAEWPKQTELEPPRFAKKVAIGEPFTVDVAVRKGKVVPVSAQVTYTFDDGDRSTEPLRPDDRGVFHGRIDAVSRPFTFTVTAGDDRTTRYAVKVVPPPALTVVAIALTPPAYTGQARTVLAPGHTQIRAVEGTAVEVEATANKPLASALLHRGGPAGPRPATLSAGGTRLAARFLVAESAPFWFALKDTEGFAGREATRFEVRALKDEAPRVTFEEPTGDREITPDGVLPLRIAADDDLGLDSIELAYKIAAADSEPTREEVVPLWEPDAGDARVRHREVAYAWEMARLRPKPEPGTLITFHADARDLLPRPNGPNVGKSRELRLRVVTREEATNRLEDRRRAIREEAERALAMQKLAQTPVAEALRTLERTRTLPQPARDALRNAESVQRQVTGRVAGPNEGLDQKIRQYLDDLKNLKLENADAEGQMKALKAGVDRIKAEHLDQAEQGLARGNKTAEEADRAPAPDADAKPEEGPPAAHQPDGKMKPEGTPKGGDPAAGREKPGAKSGDPAKPEAAKADAKAEDDPDAGPQADGRSRPEGAAKPGQQAKAKPATTRSGTSKADGSKPEAAARSGDSPPEGKAEGGSEAAKSGESSPASASKPGSKSAGKPEGAKAQAPKAALARAETHQKAIADELQKMVDSLREFDTVRGLAKDADKLLQAQEQALKQSAEAAARPDLAGKAAEGLAPQQKADLENLGGRQADLDKGLQGLEAKMDEMAQRMGESDPMTAAALKDAAAQSRHKGTSSRMKDAAEKLAKNQLGGARAGQEQARQDLKELVDAIKDHRAGDLARLIKDLKGASDDMQKLRERQAGNLQKTKEAGKLADAKQKKDELQKLAKEQAEIQKELEKQLKRLKKLKADSAAKAGGKAAGKMGKAKEAMDQDDDEDAAKDQEDALNDLAQAQDEIDEAKKQAEAELAMEQLTKMADQLRALKARQDKLVEETAGYDQARADREDKLTPGQRASVRGLAREQANLKEETAGLAEKLDGAPVYALTLRRAAESMDLAARRLNTLKTDEDTRRAEKSAARRFDQLLESLRPDKKDGQGGGGGGGGGAQAGRRGDGIPDAAQVKMLKKLQEELNTRTEELDEVKERKKTLTDDQQAEVTRLQDEQGTIADLARDIARPRKDDGEE